MRKGWHMASLRAHACTICGDEGPDARRWFLISENRWEDKLKILPWNASLAAQDGIHQVCSAAHVQELVVHWMTTGSLDYPFAENHLNRKPWRSRTQTHDAGDSVDTHGMRPIGELAVHRESMRRVLNESPHSLKTILDALLSALHRDSAERRPEVEERGTIGPAPWRV